MIEEEKISGIYEMVNQMSHEQRDDFIEKVKVINEIEIIYMDGSKATIKEEDVHFAFPK